MKYIVRTQDVDGSSRRTYKTRESAVKRFVEMSGHTFEQVIPDAYYRWPEKGLPLPKPDEIKRLRTVSDYGTVVTFEEIA